MARGEDVTAKPRMITTLAESPVLSSEFKETNYYDEALIKA